jgi:magnesium transporter
VLTIYHGKDHALEEVGELKAGNWADAVNPTPQELDRLTAHGVPAHFLRHALDEGEQPRVEREKDCTLIVLSVPFKQDGPAETPYKTTPLGIILTKDLVVTVCLRQEHLARTLLHRQAEKLPTGQHARFLLRLLFAAAELYLEHLGEINVAIERLEDRVTRSLQNREVIELLRYQKSLTFFTTALRTNRLMLERLQQSHVFEGSAEDRELLADVMTETAQALETTAIADDILSQMMDAFASIISNNLNVVMKFLAVVTVVLAVPSLIASFYGMNVGLPLEDHPLAFWFVAGLSAAVCLALLGWFKMKRWL